MLHQNYCSFCAARVFATRSVTAGTFHGDSVVAYLNYPVNIRNSEDSLGVLAVGVVTQ